MRWFSALSCAVVAGAAALAQAATITPSPTYVENFDDAAADHFVVNTSDMTWTAAGGVYGVSATGQFNDSAGASTLTVSNLGGAAKNNFTLSTAVTFDTFTTASSGTRRTDFGFNLFAGSDVPDAATKYRALIRYSSNGSASSGFFISDDGGDVTTVAGAFDNAFTTGVKYTLTVVGTYNASGHLTLRFTVADAANSETITMTDTTPHTGRTFGYRADRRRNAFTASLDDFTLTVVPEPASLALLAIGACLIAGRSRNA